MEKENNKDNIKEVIEELPGEVNKETVEELPGEVNKETVEELPGEVNKETFEKLPGELNKETFEKLPGELNKETVEKLPGELNKEIAEELNKEITEELDKKVTKKLNKEVTKKLNKENIIVRMKCVSKIYPNGVKALNGISIDISKGEFVFIVGPTGTGKSTFLKLINREEMVTEGEVIVDGRDVEKLSVNEVPLLRRRLGVIFQDFKLLPQKTCYENVAYALQVIGAGQREISYKVPRALEAVEIGRAHV